MQLGKAKWRTAFSLDKIRGKYIASIQIGDITVKESVPCNVMREFSDLERDFYLYHVNARLQKELQSKLDRKQ
jgi:hypothetical protein